MSDFTCIETYDNDVEHDSPKGGIITFYENQTFHGLRKTIHNKYVTKESKIIINLQHQDDMYRDEILMMLHQSEILDGKIILRFINLMLLDSDRRIEYTNELPEYKFVISYQIIN